MSTSSPSIPPPAKEQPYFEVSVLSAGFTYESERYYFTDGSTDVFRCPTMSFLLRHSTSKKNVLFDLGVRKDWENLPPSVVDNIKDLFPLDIPFDVVESLAKGGLEPKDIDYAILSHVHWDHVGDPELFPNTQFVTVTATKTLLASDEACSHSPEDPFYRTAYYWKDMVPRHRTLFLKDDIWSPLGPFSRAYDFFGDGSLYIIDAPGHLLGHINVLARTSADGSWIYLGGDSAHHMHLITGKKEIGHFVNPATGELLCMHSDLDAAKETIRRIRLIMQNPKVLVLIAHDTEWYNTNEDKGVIFPGKIPPKA
ncbi:hypothetical protein M422DRAFT_25542 [Sphaerobolus stellatus SS14]|nr:hypothetical protein M422DRAFT_25542 [Sphaerobolus stellatus SS14]